MTHTATGFFDEPGQAALAAYATKEYPDNTFPGGGSKMFPPPTRYSNAVLVFANSQLTVDASSVPPREPSRLLQQDEIHRGAFDTTIIWSNIALCAR